MAKGRSKSDEVRRLEREIRRLQSELRRKESAGDDTSDVLANLEAQRESLTDRLELERQRAGLVIDMLSGELDITSALQQQASTLLTQSTTMSSVLGVTIKLLSEAIELDNVFSDIAKQLDISAQEARNLAVNTKLTNEYSGLAGNNYRDIAESVGAIKGSFGIITADIEEQAGLLAVVGKNLNLSAEQQGRLALSAEATGTSTTEFAANIANAVQQFPILQRAGIRFKTIISDIADSSSDTLRNFAGAPLELVKAVAQARLLGITLNQADKVASSLLSIESSLTSEAEARVLTGQKLNFDQARYLAVTKGIEEAAQNVLAQTGGMAKFSELNRLAQESIAESMGLQVGELFDILTRQDAIAKLGRDQVDNLTSMSSIEAQRLSRNRGIEDATLKSYINQQSQLGVQERFNDLVLKLQEVVVTAFTPLLPVIDGILTFLSSDIGRVLVDLAMVGTGIALTSTGMGAPAGIGLIAAGGLGLVGEAVGAAKKVNDMVITPDGRTYETSPQDYLIATTDPTMGSGQSETILRSISSYLQNMSNESNRPVNLIINDEVVRTIGTVNSRRDTFTAGFDNTYGNA